LTYDLPQYVGYMHCLVAFIDILGFNARVENIKSKEAFQEAANLLFIMKEVEKKYGNDETLRPNLNITAVSDSVIFSIPFSDPTCVVSLFSLLHRFQYELLIKYKTLLRGYVTRGFVYHKDNIIFGRGYSEAYKQAGKIGHAPRIVLAPMLVEDAKKHLSNNQDGEDDMSIFDFLIKDSCDGSYFIDYLKPIGNLAGKIPKEQYIAERNNIRGFIETNMTNNSKDDEVIRKYHWLNNYYSSTGKYFK
jgi:hypothetical protein